MEKRRTYSQPGHRIQEDSELITHCENDEILPVSSLMPSSGIISTELIFSDIPCRFAVEDEKGIKHVIKGGLQAIGDNLSWMNDWMYKKYRLRDGPAQISLRYDTKAEKLKMLAFNIRNGKAESFESDVGGRVPEADIPGNTFFSWKVDAAVQEIMKMDGKQMFQEDDLTRLSIRKNEVTAPSISLDWTGIVIE